MKLSKTISFMALTLAASLAAQDPQHVISRDSAGAGQTRPAAVSSRPPRITGCVVKDNEGESLTFDLKIGNDENYYHVNGSNEPNQGIYRSDISFGGVGVTKRSNEDGLTRNQEVPNFGKMAVYPRKRFLEDARLAGVGLEGHTVQKLFTNSLTMGTLYVDGKPARGKLGYNLFTGTYNCRPGNCYFGDYEIRSTTPGSNVVLNYDNFVNRNRMRVSMKFGDLELGGIVKFNDITRTYSDSDGDSFTEVTSTRGCFNVTLRKSDGSFPAFAAAGQPETADDRSVRHLIAWLELMTHDIFSE